MTSGKVLEVKDLSIGYAIEGAVALAVNRFSFEIGAGQFVGLAGESGCGKSTVALALLRLLRPPGVILSGSVKLAGNDILSATPAKLRDLRWRDASIVLQNSLTALDPVYRIDRQLKEALDRARPGEPAAGDVAELLSMVGIAGDRARAYPHELSGGMRQRVVIAMALALRPKLLIMDEPTTALDVVVQRDILATIQRLRAELGFAVLFITHDLPLLLEQAERIVVMYAGTAVESTSTAALAAQALHPYSRALLSSVPRMDNAGQRLEGLPGAPPSDLGRRKGCAFAPRCTLANDRCLTQSPPVTMLDAGRQVACWLADGPAPLLGEPV
jgi:oligopeptide/dipeptide ABC transporter ATP-binding protein